LRGLVTALRTLTAVPVWGRDADCFASAIPFFPVVGALVGAVTAASGWGVLRATGDWTLGAAAVMVLVEVLLTGAIHLDGLADVADSFGALGNREKALAIMKDSRAGSFGVVALGCALLLKFTAYGRLVAEPRMWVFVIAAFAASRLAMAQLSVFLPYARADGGTAAPFVTGARPWHFVVALLVAVGFGCAAGSVGIGMVAVGTGGVALVARSCRRRYGGITGDLLGAAGEAVLLACLVFGVLTLGSSSAWLCWTPVP
jgi:adenosylcobinamide-GDP ribazoletransferase